MPISKKLRDAITAMKEAAMSGIDSVERYNGGNTGADARVSVNHAYSKIVEAVVTNDIDARDDVLIARWRDAVAKGDTVLGLNDWIKTAD